MSISVYHTALRNHLANDLNVNPVYLADLEDDELEGFLDDLLISSRQTLDLTGFDC